MTGNDILKLKYPPVVLAEISGFYSMLHVDPSKESADDAEGVYDIVEGTLKLYSASDYFKCLQYLAGDVNAHDSDDFC